ncbi:hypothetical protein AX16_006348 [Volvariella volvacea WC 439]|nr:hypothetical protein AX16_006348 [Volvariella volvacea WC 439]
MGSRFTQQSYNSSASLLPPPGRRNPHDAGVQPLVGDRSRYPMSLTEKYSLSPSPATWGTPLSMDVTEADDALHNPDPRRDSVSDKRGSVFTSRGLANLGCMAVLTVGIITLLYAFLLSVRSSLTRPSSPVPVRALTPTPSPASHPSPLAGYPIITRLTERTLTNQGGFNLGGINASGQIPDMTGNWGLIDKDTPASAYTKPSFMDPNEDLVLVFSDEFNDDGRTFYPGDDPFWEAVDLHYWGTNDLEWYDPSAATTEGGALRLTLSREVPENNHNLSYKSGMFCFTGGYIEASVRLPGSTSVHGLWPAVWTMGNLGRAGYGASVEGMWPYTYDACDVGTLPNQTYPGTSLPVAAVTGGDPYNDGALSYLPGQRLSACTCPGEPHPGPMRPDGSYVGRAAPEIDIFEATIEDDVGKVSLSSQWAPYNAGYNWLNNSQNLIIHDTEGTVLNTYHGGVWQQTTSGLAVTNQSCYELTGGCFAIYGFEYKPGFDDSYITWVNNGEQSWTLMGAGMAADDAAEISARPVPQEPMYIIANLGFSLNFGPIDFENLVLPTTMSVDYIRVYQRRDSINIGCDPIEFPTAAYIEAYQELYTNPNLTVLADAELSFPKNRLNGGC